MKYTLLCLFFLVCQAPICSQVKANMVQEFAVFSQDPVKEKKKKAAPKRCRPDNPLSKKKTTSIRKTPRKRANMGNSGGRGNMYFTRNHP